MKISDLYKKIDSLKTKRHRLKKAMEYVRVFEYETPKPAVGEKTTPIMVVSDWFDCPIDVAVTMMQTIVLVLRAECQNLAEELGVEHEELPLDE